MNKLALFGVLALALICGVSAHSYVTSPTTRSDQGSAQRGCRGPECFGPCDTPVSRKTRASTVVKRGDSLNIVWPRNNHAAGFIRFAWAPLEKSDSATEFDNNVQQFNCHEVGGCKPGNPEDPNGGDSGSMCATTLTVPKNLADGEWTLQWAWFGGAFSLGDYYSCIDYKVSGGALEDKSKPIFIGGDYANPGKDVCKFFSTNELHKCTNEPCNAPSYSGEQTGRPRGFESGSVFVPIPSPAPVPTPTPTDVPNPNPSTPAGKCVQGAYQCISNDSPAFRICSAAGTWVESKCGSGTKCEQQGNTIACVLATTPTPAPTTPTTPTPTPTTPTTPTPTPTPTSNKTCSFAGQGKCSSSGKRFYVCDGSTMKWADAQKCPSGLFCTISEAANSKGKPYCVRSGETVRAGETNGANNLFTNSLLIAIVLVSICILNF